MKVLKFGGTSVGSAKNMMSVRSIVEGENGDIVVLSAMSETTDTLVRICASIETGADIMEDMGKLQHKYYCCIDNLLTKTVDEAKRECDRHRDVVIGEARNFRKGISEGIILSQGELLTTTIFHMHLKEMGIPTRYINILDMMRLDQKGKVDQKFLRLKLNEAFQGAEKGTVFVTQGFICRDAEGNVTNLGRGGSDFSAALIGAAVNVAEVQIWTDIDGMHNNDPRYVEGTYPIDHLSFDQAAELAYFGAKILHPGTIQPCKAAGIPVFLKNTMEPSAQGTKISTEDNDDSVFQAVAAKDGITLIRIISTRMLMAYGFLRKVFEIFEDYKTPIDMITTSEVAVSLTIDNDANLDKILVKLEKLGSIEVERNNSIVCVVGHLDHDKRGVVEHVIFGLKEVPLKMISYGASDRSINVLVSTQNKVAALRALNEQLF